ncbi:MAG TPA: hypothetical protein VF606_09535, partial [Geminicoccaceae bacterium]
DGIHSTPDMKQPPTPVARAALLLAAAALPLAPLAAQEAQPPADPPASAEPAPQPKAQPAPAQTAPAPVEAAAPPAPTAQAPAPNAPAPAARRAPARTVTRTTTTVRSAPAPIAVGTAPVAVVTPAPTTPILTGPEAATTAVPPPVAPGPVEILPAAPSNGTDIVAVETGEQSGGTPVWPWLVLAGLLLLAGGLLFARRRRGTTIVEDHAYEERRISEEPSLAPAPVAAPLAAAPIAAAAATSTGTPRIELSMHPVRAGVAGADARVEFQLIVVNRGDAVAEDVRISTWMLASGSSEMERALIEPREAADTPPVTIEAGQSRTLEAAVALPTADLKRDSVLPVVVADAHYRLPDGSQRHTRVSYAVGVPDGEELAHFSVEHPSGLHEGVVAQELERARMV